MDRLGGFLIETRTSCHAWALIPNHFFLLLRTGNVPLSVMMKRLLTGYIVNFNRRHNRYGHLFRNRYKSIICQGEEGFKEKYQLRAKGYNLDKLIKRVAVITELKPDQIIDGIRDAKKTKAGGILCYWATEKMGVIQSQLALTLNRTQ